MTLPPLLWSVASPSLFTWMRIAGGLLMVMLAMRIQVKSDGDATLHSSGGRVMTA